MHKKISTSKKTLTACVALISSSYVVPHLSFAQENQLIEEEVIVRGIRRSLQSAVDIKRESSNVVDSVSAEDIGKLPDATIADSLQRVTGVQIRRNAGEGSTLNVRGMPQVGMLLNGEQFITAGSITTVQPDFTDIPAELLAGVDVIKSPTANILSGGISATVNLKSRRPFDLQDGFTFVSSVEGAEGSYSDDTDTKGVVFVGFNQGDKIAASLTVSASDVNLANYRAGLVNDDWRWVVDESIPSLWRPQVETDTNGDGDSLDRFISFQGHTAMNRFTERDRVGVSGSVQVALSDAFELSADIFHTDMDEFERTAGFVASNSWQNRGWFDPVSWRDVGSQNDPNVLVIDEFDLQAKRLMAYSRVEAQERSSTNTNIELSFDDGGAFTGSLRYLHSNAERLRRRNFADSYMNDGFSQRGQTANWSGTPVPANPNGITGVAATSLETGAIVDEDEDGISDNTVIPLHVSYLGEHPSFTLNLDTPPSINNYALTSTYSEGNSDAEASLNVLRADGRFEFNYAHASSVDFGVRFADREVEVYDYDLVFPQTMEDGGVEVTKYFKWKDPNSRFGDTNNDGETNNDDLSITPGNLSFTPGSSAISDRIIEMSDFGPVTLNGFGGPLYFVDPRSMDDPLAFQESLYPGNVEYKNPNESYLVNESSTTVYGQINFAGSTGVEGIPYRANIGLRIINTDLEITQNVNNTRKLIDVDGTQYEVSSTNGDRGLDEGDVVTSRDYTDVLPAANVVFDIADDKKVRFAYAKTMTSLNADDLGRGLSLTTTVDANNGNLFLVQSGSSNGNPEMDPWRSNNFDATFEWYFSETGLLSLGGFLMEIDSFIENGIIIRDDIPDSDGVVRNTSVQINTRQNGEGGTIKGLELGYQQAFDFLPGALDGLGVMFNYTLSPSDSANEDWNGDALPINDNSEKQMNFVLWYEKYGIQARLAHNYRSDRLINAINQDGYNIPHWQEATRYWDASISYDINSNFTVYLQGTNLTEEFETTYFGIGNGKQIANQNIFERRVNLGMRVRF